MPGQWSDAFGDAFQEFSQLGFQRSKGYPQGTPDLGNIPAGVMPPPGLGQRDVYNPKPPDATKTWETPLTLFPADVLIPINSYIQVNLPENCSNFLFFNVVGAGVQVNLNNGGFQSVFNLFGAEGVLINSMVIQTDGVSTAALKLSGFGWGTT